MIIYIHTRTPVTQYRNNRFSAVGCQTDGARVRLLTSQSLTRWRHQGTHRMIVLLLIYLPRKDERLSWPSWLTCSRRFTHIVVTCRLQSEHRTGSVRRQRPAFCQLVKSYEKFIEKLTCTSAQSVLSSGFLLSCIVYSAFSLPLWRIKMNIK